jgi:hypothetical protein
MGDMKRPLLVSFALLTHLAVAGREKETDREKRFVVTDIDYF